MKSEHRRIEPRSFVRWILATTLGWLLGFVILVALAFAWSPFGDEAQFMVGVGMGCGVGYLQGRVLRKRIAASWQWCAASTFGMGMPFILCDLFTLVGVPFPYSLPLYMALGGLFVGLLQERLLRKLSSRSKWWVPASTLGWVLPAAAVALGDARSLGSWREGIGLAGMFGGGIMLGVVSGVVIVWIFTDAAIGYPQGESPGQVSGESPWPGSSKRRSDA